MKKLALALGTALLVISSVQVADAALCKSATKLSACAVKYNSCIAFHGTRYKAFCTAAYLSCTHSC